MKRLYIEAGSLYGKRSGVGRYALRLSQELMKLRPADRFTLFSFLRPGRKPARDFDIPANAHIRFIRWFPGRAFSLLMRYGVALPIELFGLWRADVVIFPNFIAWASVLRKTRISIVHDIAFRLYPEYIQAKNLRYLEAQLARSLRRSTHVIAVSEATKRDLVKYYHVSADSIGVVYNGVDLDQFNPAARDHTPAVLQKYRLPKQYLLFVGNIEPRKNLEGLLKAYAQSYQSHRLALVIVGAKGWNDSGIEGRLGELHGLPIHRTDFVDDRDLAALYAGATAFIFPSHYEGFGIPCLEAMACGCPVICSNTSSFPEVVGDAAIQVDPTSIDELAKAITSLAGNSSLRQKLAAKGLKRAQRFTWQASARQLSAVLDSLK